MAAIDVVIRVFWLILPKTENRFVLFAFLWNLFVAGRKTPNDNWKNYAINTFNILRLISLPIFHKNPVEWLLIFTTSSILSFILQKKLYAGIALTAVLHTVLYFLLLGLSPLTYWNVGKQFFNLLIWPDDPRQLAFQIGMTLSAGVMAVHFLLHFGEKLLEIVRIDWMLVTAFIHPFPLFYLLPNHSNLQILGVWYSLLLISIKYQQQRVIQCLAAVFVFIYMKLLTS